MIGQTVSHYEITEKLGGGGMGIVYLAEDTRLDREVAIKFLPPDYFGDRIAEKRFEREAKAAAALSHPHICMVFDVGEHEEQPYLVMERLKGQTLKHRLDEGPIDIDEVLKLATQVAAALQAAHAQGIIHRDIKPANIFITAEGYAKVLDFGLAKRLESGEEAEEDLSSALTRAGATLGTLAYMSPEQLRGKELDVRTDVFSFGVVLYEMLSGVHPFRRESANETVGAILNEEPVPLTRYLTETPEALQYILRKMLAKTPERRHGSMRGVQNDLEQLVEDSGRQPMAPSRKNLRWLWLTTVPVVLLVVLLSIYWSNFSQSESEGTPPQLTQTADEQKSIAVLPFDNLSPNPDDEYFSDGMTEEIIAVLTQIRELKVSSRTSAMRYKDSGKGLKEIAEELGVATILEGSARQAEGRVRITAQLIDTQADELLWAETYERELKGIFAIQSDVALQIAGALKAELSPAEKHQIEKKPTENIQAYNLFLMGRHFRNIETPSENLKRAVDYYEQAIREDPDFAEAYAGLAEAIFLLAYYEPGGEWTGNRAEAELQRALELDEMIAAAHVMKGTFSWAYHNDRAGAVREYERAIELDPTLVNAHREYGLFLFRQCGIFDEALLKLQEALRLDPLSPLLNDHLFEFYLASGDVDKAVEPNRKVLELAPSPSWGNLNSGHVHLLFGEYEKASLEAKKALQIEPNSYTAEWLLTLAYLCQGRLELASKVSQQRLSGDPLYRHWGVAGIVALWAGNQAEARSFLERAYELAPLGTSGSHLYWPANFRFSTALAYILWKSGQREQAEPILSENLRLDNPQRIEAGVETAAPKRLYDIAMIYAIRGEKEEAYGWLQKAIDAGWRYYDITSQDPVWSAFHGEARFQQMMAEVKAKVDKMRVKVRQAENELGWE